MSRHFSEKKSANVQASHSKPIDTMTEHLHVCRCRRCLQRKPILQKES
ncbi:hypothetical protein [Leptospira ainazelensis]|nr:hypothetical protein [Leptospira ainazelensis]